MFHIVNDFENFLDDKNLKMYGVSKQDILNLIYLKKNKNEPFYQKILQVIDDIDKKILVNSDCLIKKNTVLFRARKVTAKDFAYDKNNSEEVDFWDNYIKGYQCGFGREDILQEYINKKRNMVVCLNEEISNDLSNGYCGLRKELCGAPPKSLCKGQRCNIDGERVLYLGDAIETCLLECCANCGETFNIGEFVAVKDLYFFDISTLSEYYAQFWFSCLFSDVEQEGNYIKSQIISFLIQKKGYAGIKYRSVKNCKGFCYAVFDPEKFECRRSYLVKPIELTVKYIR